MADMFTRTQRSEIMSKVKGRENLATELRLIRIFRASKIRGWRRRWPLFGKPDFVFPNARLAVFVDGCFWHSCRLHGSLPQSNRDFWIRKLERNVQRDKLVGRTLRNSDWRVLRIWQHELRAPLKVSIKVNKALSRCSKNNGIKKK
jgi:DNA mismatch endonuclease (patch repair protein)